MKKLLASLIVLGALMAAAAVQMYRVHEEGWEWRLWASAAPPKVHYDGRNYTRGVEETPPDSLDVSVRGHTPGGGDILDTDSPGATTLIWVRDGDAVWIYGLMGGP